MSGAEVGGVRLVYKGWPSRSLYVPIKDAPEDEPDDTAGEQRQNAGDPYERNQRGSLARVEFKQAVLEWIGDESGAQCGEWPAGIKEEWEIDIVEWDIGEPLAEGRWQERKAGRDAVQSRERPTEPGARAQGFSDEPNERDCAGDDERSYKYENRNHLHCTIQGRAAVVVGLTLTAV